jgi:hypothetical protein
VRANYDSLTLKLQDSLDLFEIYAEKPTFTSFFTNLIRSMVTDYRQVQGYTVKNPNFIVCSNFEAS